MTCWLCPPFVSCLQIQERLVESAKNLQRELREGGAGQADDGPGQAAAG